MSISDTPGGQAAQRRMRDNGMSVRAAFDSMQLGFTFDEVVDWVRFPATNVLRAATYDAAYARIAGIAAAAMIVGAEVERAKHADPL